MLLSASSYQKPEIHISESDIEILRSLAFSAKSMQDVADDLLGELDRAETVPDGKGEKYIGIGTVATFNTSLGDQKTVQVVLPAEADISVGKISVLTPVGVALIGLSEGQSIEWKTLDGRVNELTILSVGVSSQDAVVD